MHFSRGARGGSLPPRTSRTESCSSSVRRRKDSGGLVKEGDGQLWPGPGLGPGPGPGPEAARIIFGLAAINETSLRKIFGVKRDDVTGEWRKLHNTELHALYSSPHIIRNIKSRRLRWAGHVARMGESRNTYRVLVGRPEGKRPLGRPRRRWEDNIKMGLREVGYDDRDWINLAQDRRLAASASFAWKMTSCRTISCASSVRRRKGSGGPVNAGDGQLWPGRPGPGPGPEAARIIFGLAAIIRTDVIIFISSFWISGEMPLKQEEEEKSSFLVTYPYNKPRNGTDSLARPQQRNKVLRFGTWNVTSLYMGNACYYSVEKLLSSSLLSKNLKVRIYKTVILPVVLYGCETWTLTLREEHRLRVFENKVLRKIFGAMRDEVTGEWRKLHNTELHALYSSPDIIRNIKSRRLRWAGHVARMGESRNAYRVLVGRPEGKRPLGRPRRRWEDNIKMDLREVGYDEKEWINLAQDRDRWRAYVRAAMNLRVP
ncbi:hypothetical protein ANN_24020 [Periplaneta americana]|uniref:Endonuclease-reverse transcriptase n=1 Tax=Periplaneta americana TaxID=6978 RepID=A0ABQ8S1X1_PERAM|nr:hypothetical protein ANN_24020 [Periplaneta americana]